MTAPRWIVDALGDAYDMRGRPGRSADKIATALMERLPIEAMIDAIAGPPSTRDTCTTLIAKIIAALCDGDPEVVSFTELYQDACRALDDAGAPYAIDAESSPDLAIESTAGEMTPRKPVEVSHVPAHRATIQLDLAGRIRWLARQRRTHV